MPSRLSQLVEQLRQDHFVRPPVNSEQLEAARLRGVPNELIELYAFCDGALLGEGEDFLAPDGKRYRLCIPRLAEIQTVQSVGFVMDGDPLYTASADWWQLVDYGDSNCLACDATSSGGGQILDVFHETAGESGAHDVVARSVSDLLYRFLENPDTFWLRDSFQSLGTV